jgi:PAS domain S-box-containing protein
MQALIDFFGIKDLIPHGYCPSWSPVLLWLNVISDLLITLAYYSIPLILIYFIRQRKDLRYPWLIVMFSAFIVACGTTHLLSAITIWIPLYWLDGILKGFTAVLSVITAVLMIWIVPRALSLPSGSELQAEIQQRKSAEEALRVANVELQKNTARTQLLVDSALDGIISMDHSGNVIGWNNQTERIFGYSSEQALGRELADLIVPSAYRERHRHAVSQFMTADASNIVGKRLEISGLRADGSEFPIELTVSALEQKNGYFFSAFVRDITERKKAEEATQAASQYARSLIEASLDPLVTISAEGKITDVNIATEQVTGVNRGNLIGSDFADYFTDPERARDGYRQVFSQGFVTDYPLAIHHVSGNVTDVLYNASVYRDGNGEVLGVFAAARDITERREREHQLGLFHSLFELTSDCVFMISPKQDFRFVFVNDAACRHYGVEREQLLKWSVSDWDSNFKNQADLDALWEEVKARKGFLIETVHRVASGRKVPVEVSLNYLLYKGEEYLAGYFHDITERKLMEDELKAGEAKFRSIIEVSPIPMAMNDERLNVTFLNSAFVQAFGYCIDDIPTLEDWWPRAYPDPDYRDWVKTTWVTTLEKAKQEQTEFPPMEVAIRCKNNSIKIVLATAVTIQHDFAGMNLSILYDITQLKQIETELTRSNAELEQFAYAVSHDMRQPLRMVTSYLSLIENALTGQLNEETQQFLDFAINGAKRMDAMILSLLDYSRIGRKFEAKTRLSSKASLDEALAFLNPELRACGGEIKVTGDWPELFASRDELTRLLQNLIGNALKYHEENQPPQVHIHGTICAGSLRVEVRDQGIGIEPSQMDRLFKVFSRLQARSRFDGTGVGLALCRKIVEHHGGTIGVESAGEGQGCVFWFELPIMNTINSE